MLCMWAALRTIGMKSIHPDIFMFRESMTNVLLVLC
jgi:hypothetical protein